MKSLIRFIPNSVTITRIIMTFIFSYFILNQAKYGQHGFVCLISVFFLICFSDLFDGKLARKIGCSSTLGAKLDVLADLLYMIFSYTVLIVMGVLPIWFLGFICSKFIEFVATSNFIKQYHKESSNPFVFDKVGRIAAAAFFVIPGISCILNYYMPHQFSVYIINLILYGTLAGGIYSSFWRIQHCFAIKKRVVGVK